MSSASHHKFSTSNKGAATHPALHIRDANDAHVLLEAVRLNMLPLIKRRLTANEREMLGSGNVFVWEEAEDDGGLLRWTDGRKWSQSRMRGEYLYYEEKVETTQEEKDAKAARRARKASDPSAVAVNPNRRKDRPSKPDGLTKQTYSALVYLPGSANPRRWHVVAYFSGNDYIHLPVIETYDYLRNIRVPDGMFMSSKANGARIEHFSYYMDTSESHARSDRSPTLTNCYSHPMPPHYQREVSAQGSLSPSSSSSTLSPPPTRYSIPFSPSSSGHGISLPPISALSSPHSLSDNRSAIPPRSGSSIVQLSQPSSSNYAPLSSEDRRVLNKFRVVL